MTDFTKPGTKLPDEYTDAGSGIQVLCGCGHYRGVKSHGEKHAMCFTCELVYKLGYAVDIVYPDRMPDRRA